MIWVLNIQNLLIHKKLDILNLKIWILFLFIQYIHVLCRIEYSNDRIGVYVPYDHFSKQKQRML